MITPENHEPSSSQGAGLHSSRHPPRACHLQLINIHFLALSGCWMLAPSLIIQVVKHPDVSKSWCCNNEENNKCDIIKTIYTSYQRHHLDPDIQTSRYSLSFIFVSDHDIKTKANNFLFTLILPYLFLWRVQWYLQRYLKTANIFSLLAR